MTVENLKSTAVTNLDASPVVPNIRGSGPPSYDYAIDDYVTATASGVGSIGSTYRLCRIPVNAKIKTAWLMTSGALDSNASPALIIDLNLAFSDSTVDGTQAQYQGTIPTSANTGAVTTVASYSSPNKIFGSTTASQMHSQLAPTNLIHNGTLSNYPLSFTQTELWSVFGFTNPYGVPLDPGGFFDVLMYVSTGAATGASQTLRMYLDIVV